MCVLLPMCGSSLGGGSKQEEPADADRETGEEQSQAPFREHWLQRILGEHPDSVVSRFVARQLGVQAELEGDNAFTLGLLHGLEQGRGALPQDASGKPGRNRPGRSGGS
ncbi:hypothetical protein GCM10027601_02740 [Nocardioides ungokensis]